MIRILGSMVISISILSASYANSVRTINPLSVTKCCIGSKFVNLCKSGCCSWHGGVCGCENDRSVCCDGSLSPTCGC